jgi:hypothetical protein
VDQILSWLVLVVPVALGLVLILVPAKHEDEKRHMRWRYILGVSLIIYGGLTWVQQSRATKNSAKERESAIRETSERVASETSAKVTKLVGEEYQAMITDLSGQIQVLKQQLSAQAKDVGIIKGSNIVTGKNPIKVEVTNQGLVPSQQPLANLSWTQDKTGMSDGKATVRIAFRVDAFINIPAFIAICDRNCKAVGAICSGVSQATYLSGASPVVAGVLFNSPRPLSAGTPCFLTLASGDESPINVIAFRILKESELPLEDR